MLPLSWYLATAVILYIIGLYTLITKKNLIRLILGIEIMVNAAHINFIAISSSWRQGFVDPLAHGIVIISIGVAACVSAVLLLITYQAYKHYGTLDVRIMRKLKG
ncbi:MAG: NADH-quinone oxidoreductase subunit K [Candidatus Caldarchaeales archaeon]